MYKRHKTRHDKSHYRNKSEEIVQSPKLRKKNKFLETDFKTSEDENIIII